MKLRGLCVPFVTVLLMAATAATAQAHSSQILIRSSTLIYQELPGIDENFDNALTIALKSDSFGSYYEVKDPESTGMFFPAQCVPLDPAQDDVRCPSAGISALYVRLGTGTVPKTTSDSINISAPTPATLSGGSVTNAGGPRTSNITAGPVGGNVLYGNPGSGALNSLNGFADTIHACPGNIVHADSVDTVIWDCAPPPPPPGTTTTAKVITLRYKKRQAILPRRFVQLEVTATMPLTVRAHGTVKLPGRGGRRALVAATVQISSVGLSVPLRLRIPHKLIPLLRRAFATHRRIYAKVEVDARDPITGRSYSIARRIGLVR